MLPITIESEAGNIFTKLVRLRTEATARVHVVSIEIIEPPIDHSSTEIAEAGGAFAWLADEPDLYTDADLLEAPGGRVRV